jgi:hypothetical protein
MKTPRKVKPKVFVALSVRLSDAPSKHWASNRNCQYTVVCRTTSAKKFAELIGSETSEAHLRHMGVMATDNEKHIAVCQKDDTIYYQVEPPNPDAFKWFEYTPRQS